jgi:predicted metalloendopeptidase
MRLYFQQLFYNRRFYNYQADEAVNYGGIGGIVDMKFLVDDSGSRYNADDL